MPFPDTGPYKTHFGMFVGEEDHANTNIMATFNTHLKLLSTKVDVIFLEMYPEGQSPRLKFASVIEGDITRFNKHFNVAPAIAKNIYRLWSLAYYFGMDVQGIEQPDPEGIPPGGIKYFLHRTSKDFNTKYLDCVDKYAATKRSNSLRFCIYGGLGHATAFRALAPQMPLYEINQAGNAFIPIVRKNW